MKQVRRVVELLRAALREIFDEAAYSRFLQRTHANSSPAAYAEFWSERETGGAPRIKCC